MYTGGLYLGRNEKKAVFSFCLSLAIYNGWVTQRKVIIISILVHSSNEKCNALQTRNGLYLAASNASKSVHQWATCTGLSISPTSIMNARDLMIKNQKLFNQTLGAMKVLNLVYNNCNFKFSIGQSTDLKDHTFESITTGLFLNMHNGILPEDLEYAEFIWEQHPNNENSTNPFPALLTRDILPGMASIRRLKEHFQWHILAVLVNEYFPKFRSELGEPPSDFKLQL